MTAISEVLHRGALITKAKKGLILLHGRGGEAKSILSLSDKLCDPSFYIAAPQAKSFTWYPYSFMEEERQNDPFLSQSIQAIKELLDQIAEHIPKPQIILAGFSQGACLALEVSARYATQYGGIVAFTGGLIGKTIDARKYQGNFEGTRVFMSNGDNDPHVPLIRSKETKELMEHMKAHVTLQVYEGRPHTITEEEIHVVKTLFFGG